jgi:hypothetical protein
MGDQLTTLLQNPVVQAAIPVGAGIASAYSPYAAKGIGAATDMFTLQQALRRQKEQDALDKEDRALKLSSYEEERKDRERSRTARQGIADIFAARATQESEGLPASEQNADRILNNQFLSQAVLADPSLAKLGLLEPPQDLMAYDEGRSYTTGDPSKYKRIGTEKEQKPTQKAQKPRIEVIYNEEKNRYEKYLLNSDGSLGKFLGVAKPGKESNKGTQSERQKMLLDMARGASQ